MNKPYIAQILTYAGLMPFVGLGFIQWVSPEAFISGMHWGIYLYKESPVNLFIQSNIVALSAWVSLLCSAFLGTLILIMCFMCLIGVDYILRRHEILAPWFWRLRVRVTVIVILALVVHVLN